MADPNPFFGLYDVELQEHSKKETNDLPKQLKNGESRFSWEFQQRRRKANADKTRDDIEAGYEGLNYRGFSIPRTSEPDNVATKITKLEPPKDIDLAVVWPNSIETSQEKVPCFFFIHGGARVGSSRFVGLGVNGHRWAEEFNAVTVSVEYRLAPNQGVGEDPVNDCYEALDWVFQQIPRDDGTSSGGGLAASLGMKWKDDTDKHPLGGIFMEAPQLADRNMTDSKQPFDDGNMFIWRDALLGWKCSLGEDRVGRDDVTKYEVPALAQPNDLRGLPPVYLDVGSVEPFRDEVEYFADLLSRAGVRYSCYVFEGGFHGYFAAVPDALISRLTQAARKMELHSLIDCGNGKKEESIEEYEELKKELEDLRGRPMVTVKKSY
ncbi:Alpha/Beta hydrolase protein [Whalleya microplaca]|nr:Alpha/Beta hydrolase protein [Whalleya microplaca]